MLQDTPVSVRLGQLFITSSFEVSYHQGRCSSSPVSSLCVSDTKMRSSKVGSRAVYAIFREKVTLHLLEHVEPLYQYCPTWAPFNSNDGDESTSNVIYRLVEDIRTTQTTSPQEGCWKGW